MIYKSPIQGWRQYASRYGLHGVICKLCKKTYFPKKYLCECGASDFETHKFVGSGTLISFTNISSPAAEFKSMPTYCLGLIQLDDGPVIMAQIADTQTEDLKAGVPLQAVFRRFYACGVDGIIEYGLKFVPL